MLVVEGEAPNLDDLDEAVHESDCVIKEQATSGPGAAGEYHRVRLTPLDPLRPARDLLEDLLSGIRSCRLVYSEYADADGLEDMEEGLDEAIDQAFCRDVRDRAAADRSRLL